MNLLAQKIWSNDFFKICYHAGGSTELCRQYVYSGNLAEGLLANRNLLQFIPGNISLILQFNNNTIT